MFQAHSLRVEARPVSQVRRVQIDECLASVPFLYTFIDQAAAIVAGDSDIASAQSVCDYQYLFNDAVDLPPRGHLRMDLLTISTANTAPITGMAGLVEGKFHEPDPHDLRRIVGRLDQPPKLDLESMEVVKVRIIQFDQ